MVNLNRTWRRDGFDYHFGLLDVRNNMPSVIVRMGYPPLLIQRDMALLAGLLVLVVFSFLRAVRKNRAPGGTNMLQAWLQLRFAFWLAWLLRITAFDGLSFVRLFEENEGDSGAFIAVVSMWTVGSIVDVGIAELFRSPLRRSLGWEASRSHLVSRVLREDLCILPIFLILLLAGDPQHTFPTPVILAVVLFPFQFVAWRMANAIPLSWRTPDASGEYEVRLRALAQRTSHTIRSVFIVRRGEPLLAAVTTLPNYAVAISEELRQMREELLDALVCQRVIERDQRRFIAHSVVILLVLAGVLGRFEASELFGLAGTCVVLTSMLLAGLVWSWSRRRSTFKADLAAVVLTGAPQTLISAIWEQSRIRNDCRSEWQGRLFCYEPPAAERARRLAKAYHLDLQDTSSGAEAVVNLSAPVGPIHSLAPESD